MIDNIIKNLNGWDDPDIWYKTREWIDRKYLDRPQTIKIIMVDVVSYILPVLPNILLGNLGILDFSCGPGIFLEIMRYLGHYIQGVDIPGNEYIPLVSSQNIPVIYHDGNDLPYPIDNKSFDLVYNNAAITFIKADWNNVLDEFFRISNECVFVKANSGRIFDEHGYILDNYKPPVNWSLVNKNKTMYIWKKEKNNVFNIK